MSLTGLRVLVPRSGATGVRWAAAIRELGGVPVIAPMIEAAPPADTARLADAAERWNRGAYDWVAVTSPRGAIAFSAAGARPRDHRRAAAVGPATADELGVHGFSVDLVPPRDFSARGLARAFASLLDAPASILLPLSELADDTLEQALRSAGHTVERVDAYRTVPAAADPSIETDVAQGRIDLILVSSGSVASEIARRFTPIPRSARLIAIGEPTAAALTRLGLPADAVASPHTIDGMLDAAAELAATVPAPPAATIAATPDPTRARDQEAPA